MSFDDTLSAFAATTLRCFYADAMLAAFATTFERDIYAIVIFR